MTHYSSITGRATISIMIVLFLLVTGICSCLQAQMVWQVANADKKVNVGSVIDPISKAETLQHAINGPYEELKPVLAPGGNRLYFSRAANPNNTTGVDDNEDIWYSEVDKTNNTWSEPVRLPGLLNNAGPNYINNVSVSGDTIILGNQYLKKSKNARRSFL